MLVFVIDYDASKEPLRHLRVTQQATLLAFKGRAEIMRLVMDADPDKIQMLFEATR